MSLKISIIIPTFNRKNYLAQAIESALNQDYNNIEVIVSDNASTDGTEELVKHYLKNNKLKYFKNEKNIGMVNNWRKALNEHANGDYFLILSDDDYFIDFNYISKAIKILNKDSEIVMVYANGFILNENQNKKTKLSLPFKEIEEGWNVFLTKYNIFPQDFTLCNIVFNRKLALKLNAFSNEFNIGCDSELFLKMCLNGKVGVIKDYVSVYRVHSDNLLSKMGKDYKLLVNNLDHILEPYKLAKKSNIFSKKEIKSWENTAVMPVVRETLLVTLINHRSKYPKLLRLLWNKNKNLLFKAHDPVFFIKNAYKIKNEIDDINKNK